MANYPQPIVSTSASSSNIKNNKLKHTIVENKKSVKKNIDVDYATTSKIGATVNCHQRHYSSFCRCQFPFMDASACTDTGRTLQPASPKVNIIWLMANFTTIKPMTNLGFF
jgi:hypothetical protein